MEEIILREYSTYREDEVLDLYRSVGWSAYYDHPDTLRKAFEKSLWILAAWKGSRLVGLLRVVGDGETVVFLQDILVHPSCQRQGIGRRLVAGMLQRYAHVRQLHLHTDDVPSTTEFYKAVGFTPLEEIHGKAFTRLRY